jgi:hypothetical protein
MDLLYGDRRPRMLITGDELRELKRHTVAIDNKFGRRKIENYKGTRPLILDYLLLKSLLKVMDQALNDERYYPDPSAPGYLALKNLEKRLREAFDAMNRPKSSRAKAVSAGSRKAVPTPLAQQVDTVYQLKITLLNFRPPIWRRIQVRDCTLKKLHEHIQTAMGWFNSHLHHFRLGEQLYGDSFLMEDSFEDLGYEDSTSTLLSDLLPKQGKRLLYEYDFGDSWHHEVLFEKCVPGEPGQKYPRCVDGRRTCPPEDVGGVWGYAEFLEAVQNPDHEEHEEMLEWVGGKFDPEAFDPAVATRRMQQGLPDWRRMM